MLTGAALLVGGGGAAVAAGLIRALLFEVTPYDTRTFLAVAAVLAGVALLATWIPARRAVRVDPSSALRSV